MTEAQTDPVDPFLWLEDVQGEAALAWVRERNAESQKVLMARPEYAPTRERLLQVMNSKERIPYISRRADYFYNLWQDETHKRGLWRRTSLAEYRRAAPAWETVLDLDALGSKEGENWVWGGAVGLAPSHHRCLVMLSRGGADASVVREFDTAAKAFVAGGFELPEAKSDVDWIDADTIFVGTDFGPGSMTDSGYPRVIKRWKRGTPLTDAVTVFEGEKADVSVRVSVDTTPGHERTLIVRSLDFYNSKRFVLQGLKLLPLDLPDDASVSFWNSAGAPADSLLMELRSDLKTPTRSHPRGSLLAIDAAAYQRGERHFEVLFEPTATRSLAGFALTRSHVLVNVLDNVASRLEEWRRTAEGLTRREVAAPFPGSLGVSGLHDPMLADDALAESYLLSYSDFLTPDTLSLGQTGTDTRAVLKSLPATFDATGMRAEQSFATSADGTRIPYFVVWPRGLSALSPATGSTATLLYGYGGFEISMQPLVLGRVRQRVAGARWRGRGCQHPRRRRVRPGLAPGGRERTQAAQLRRFHRGGARPDPAWHHEPAAPRHRRWQQRRAARGRGFHAAPRPVQRGRVQRAAARHAALPQAAGGCLVDGRIRRPRPARRVEVHLEVQPVPEPAQRGEVPARAVHHLDPRRPCAPGSRAQDGGAFAVARARGAVLREHRRRPRWRGRQRTARARAGAGDELPVAAARPLNLRNTHSMHKPRRSMLTLATAPAGVGQGSEKLGSQT